jgi:V8-like Glu-specific endopeptidase
VLTAAHCVDAGGVHGEVRPAQLNIDGGEPDYMTCRMPSIYAAASLKKDDYPRLSADYALCLLDDDLSAIAAFNTTQYEDIDTAKTLHVNDPILITGYGCTSVKVKNGKVVAGDDNTQLLVGDGRVSQAPAGRGDDANYILSRSKTADDPALCPGDSGGPLLIGATLHHQTVSRRIAAVNSTLTVDGPSATLISRFGALATPEFTAFIDRWLSDNGRPTVCGYNVKAGTWPCRD